METSEIVKQLEPWIEKNKRTAWKPVVQTGDGGLTASKFSGTPWIAEHDSWPLCKTSRKPLQLFLQLNLAELPRSLKGTYGKGLLQLFYCTGDLDGTCDCFDGWEPFSGSNMARIIHPLGTPLKTDIPQNPRYFPAKTITDWQPIVDHADPVEHGELGLKYTYDWDAGTVTLECKELGLVFDNIQDDRLAENIAVSTEGDKLAGWPRWIQGVEYPNCPICRTRMSLVFQLDSEDNLPYMFGDVGIGHITQCPKHKEVVAFGWACH